MKMWATVPPVGSSVSLNWLEPSEQKYPHACVFAAAWGNVLMPQLIRLTLTIPQGKSLHICNGQIITSPQMFVSFSSLFVLALFMSLEDHQRFFTSMDGHCLACSGLCRRIYSWRCNIGGCALCLKGKLSLHFTVMTNSVHGFSLWCINFSWKWLYQNGFTSRNSGSSSSTTISSTIVIIIIGKNNANY